MERQLDSLNEGKEGSGVCSISVLSVVMSSLRGKNRGLKVCVGKERWKDRKVKRRKGWREMEKME